MQSCKFYYSNIGEVDLVDKYCLSLNIILILIDNNKDEHTHECQNKNVHLAMEVKILL